jgi:hypothetical protein
MPSSKRAAAAVAEKAVEAGGVGIRGLGALKNGVRCGKRSGVVI